MLVWLITARRGVAAIYTLATRVGLACLAAGLCVNVGERDGDRFVSKLKARAFSLCRLEDGA